MRISGVPFNITKDEMARLTTLLSHLVAVNEEQTDVSATLPTQDSVQPAETAFATNVRPPPALPMPPAEPTVPTSPPVTDRTTRLPNRPLKATASPTNRRNSDTKPVNHTAISHRTTPKTPKGDNLPQPNLQHPDWKYTGPPCEFVPSETPQRLDPPAPRPDRRRSPSEPVPPLPGADRQQDAAGSNAIHQIIADLHKDAAQHRAALASSAPPAQPSAEWVTATKALLAATIEQLPKPGDNAGRQDPDSWRAAIFEMLRADALMHGTDRILPR